MLLRMKIQKLVNILRPTGLSPEDLAPRLGVSSMTYRRWLRAPAGRELPPKYESTIREGIHRLIAENLLDTKSDAVAEFLRQSSASFFDAALRGLDMEIPAEFLALASNHEDQVTLGLSQIGANSAKQKEVNESVKKIRGFESFGAEWKKRVKTLLLVIQSRKLGLVDKLVAYGALFYLITPFDLIPDSIPVVGYIDDFAILGFAVAFYLHKFPKLTGMEGGK